MNSPKFVPDCGWWQYAYGDAYALFVVRRVFATLSPRSEPGFSATLLERVMNWRENSFSGSSFSWLRGGPPGAMDHWCAHRIEMRIPRSAWFPCDLRFPHS